MGRGWMAKVGNGGRHKSKEKLDGVDKGERSSLGRQDKGGGGVRGREKVDWRRRKSTYLDPVH